MSGGEGTLSTETDAVSRSRWRTPVARLLTVLGVLLLLVSIAANFVERQALDRDEVEETAEQLIQDELIRQEIASTLTDELFAGVDIRAELEQALPPEQQGLAGPIAGGLRPLAERLALGVLERPRFQQAWVRAVGGAQEQVVRVLDDKARFLETEGGVVTVDLRPLLVELTDRLPIVANLSERLPPDAGLVTLFEVEQLERAQRATRFLRFVADWIWVLALAAWAAAVYIARDRRKEVRAIAIGIVVVGVLVLLVRRLAGSYLVDQLSSAASDEQAIENTWSILTRLLADAGWAAIALGVVALIGVWLVGPSRRGTTARRWLAPYLRRPGLTFGVAAFLFVLLVLWGPIAYVERPLTLLVLAILAAVGVVLLSRQTEREFPDAQPGAIGSPMAWVRGSPSSPADELERYARLHREGGLTDAEFAAVKAELLARPPADVDARQEPL